MDNQPFQKSSQSQGTEASPCPALMPLPDSDAYGDVPQFPKGGVLPFRRTIRRQELRQIVPLTAWPPSYAIAFSAGTTAFAGINAPT